MMATQIYTGAVVSGFVVVGEAPVRDKAGRLVWLCECPAAKHRIEVLHSALTYSAPTCAECGRQAVLSSLGRNETEAQWEAWVEKHSIPHRRYSHRAQRGPKLEADVDVDAVEVELEEEEKK